MTRTSTEGLLWLPAVGDAPPPECGGKARGLAAIEAAGFTTVPWFVVRAGAEFESDELRPAIAAACDTLSARGVSAFAVRSSALDEDGTERSFAGQYRSMLNVPDAAGVSRAVEVCQASASTPAVDGYLPVSKHGGSAARVAVIVQALVPAVVSGVAFSRAPSNATDEIVVVATRGLGPPLVGGEVDGDEYRVTPDEQVVVRRVDAQAFLVEPAAGGGLARRSISPPRVGRCLDDPQVLAVARAARCLERWCGAPQDVEWAYAPDGSLIVLQTRPITALTSPLSQEVVRVWDNANIVESFGGVTTPLTFSVAREAYADVYRRACRALGVTHRTIEANADLFEEMIGLIRGRVYYNLNSWHRLLALLPGFRYSQSFMERMMGARRPDPAPREGIRSLRWSAGRLCESLWVAILLLWRLISSRRDTRRFRVAIDGLRTDFARRPMEGMSPDALLAQHAELHQRALANWGAPIMNDLFLMVFHGALRQAAERWLGPDADALLSRLLRLGRLASTEPATAIQQMAAAIRSHAPWQRALAEMSDAAFLEELRSGPALDDLKSMLDAYLDRWGERCPEELKLDRASYRDDPTPLIRLLRSMWAAPTRNTTGNAPDAAVREMDRRLATAGPLVGPLRRAVLHFLATRARYHLGAREEMRFARGHVFGMARRIFAAMGHRLAERGILASAADIHYLDIHEVRGAIRGTLDSSNLHAVVASRRGFYDRYRSTPAPPNRFETRGPVVSAAIPSAETTGGEQAQLRGVGASPGRVRAPCIVLDDPRDPAEARGRIVVARSTDPGWLPIFLSAVGVVVERGSFLSHSAILARELGVPTVFGVGGITATVCSGQIVELDGSTGEVWLAGDEDAAEDATGAG